MNHTFRQRNNLKHTLPGPPYHFHSLLQQSPLILLKNLVATFSRNTKKLARTEEETKVIFLSKPYVFF